MCALNTEFFLFVLLLFVFFESALPVGAPHTRLNAVI